MCRSRQHIGEGSPNYFFFIIFCKFGKDPSIGRGKKVYFFISHERVKYCIQLEMKDIIHQFLVTMIGRPRFCEPAEGFSRCWIGGVDMDNIRIADLRLPKTALLRLLPPENSAVLFCLLPPDNSATLSR